MLFQKYQYGYEKMYANSLRIDLKISINKDGGSVGV